VFKWPDRQTVLAVAREWSQALQRRDRNVRAVLCIGSAARGDWGVGSDIDLIVLIEQSEESAVDRYRRYYPDGLPVPADLWVYTLAEWESLAAHSPGLRNRIDREKLLLSQDI